MRAVFHHGRSLSFLFLVGIFLNSAFILQLLAGSFTPRVFLNSPTFEVIVGKVLFLPYFPNRDKKFQFFAKTFMILRIKMQGFFILLNSSSTYFFSLLLKTKSDPEQIVEGGELCERGAGKDGFGRDSGGC